MSRTLIAALFISLFALAAAGAASPGVSTKIQNSIERAAPNAANEKDRSLIVKAQVLFDRAHFSPGEIDRLDGENFRSAIRAFQEVNGLATTAKLDIGTWNALVSKDSAPVLESYTISDADIAGPFTKSIPTDLVEMAKLPGLSYVRPLSELAEKFHMSQTLLRELNPGVEFERAGAAILVANVAEMKLHSGGATVEAVPPTAAVSPIATTIVVAKPAHNLRAYDQTGRLLAFYAATLGSEEKPAPSGVFKVKGVVWNPKYYYDPKFAWKEVKVDQQLTVAPGSEQSAWFGSILRLRRTGYMARRNPTISAKRNPTAASV